MLESSCRWCAYGNQCNDTCRECSRHFADMFTPTRKSTKLHTAHFCSASRNPSIALNKAGPGYYVGHQTDTETLEWVCTVEEAGRVLIGMIKQENFDIT